MLKPEEAAKKLRDLVLKSVGEYHGLAVDEGSIVIDCLHSKYTVNQTFALQHKDQLLELLSAFGDTFSPEALRNGVDHIEVGDELAKAFPDHSILELYVFGHAAGVWKVLHPRERRKRGFDKPIRGHEDFGVLTVVSH